MIVAHTSETEKREMFGTDVKNASMKVLVSPKEGWKDHVMRILEIEKDGYSPRHIHDWPHINYIIKGEGILFIEGIEHSIKEGSYAYVPSNTLHQFINTGENILEFICIVPEKGHK